MDAPLTDDQRMFRDSVAGYLRDRYSDAERRRIMASEPGWSREHWRAFARDLGLLSVGFAEDDGGLGGTAADHAMIMQLFGTALVVEPYVSTAVIGGGFLKYKYSSHSSDLMGQLMAGDLITAYAHGEPATRYHLAHVGTTAERAGAHYVINGVKSVVLSGPYATHYAVVARTGGGARSEHGVSLFLVDARSPGISRRDYKTISGGPASDIEFRNVSVPVSMMLAPEGDALPAIEAVIDEAIAVVCAEAIGVMARLLDDTLAYTSARTQFGKRLADFQVLQHRMVDMLIARQHSSSITERAVNALTSTPIERAKAVSAAKVYVGKSLKFVGQNAIQLHGGMGMTDDLAVGFFFKRAVEIERQFGTVEHHLTRFQRLRFGGAGAAST